MDISNLLPNVDPNFYSTPHAWETAEKETNNSLANEQAINQNRHSPKPRPKHQNTKNKSKIKTKGMYSDHANHEQLYLERKSNRTRAQSPSKKISPKSLSPSNHSRNNNKGSKKTGTKVKTTNSFPATAENDSEALESPIKIDELPNLSMLIPEDWADAPMDFDAIEIKK